MSMALNKLKRNILKYFVLENELYFTKNTKSNISIKLNCSLNKCELEWNSMQKVELIQTIKFPKSFRNGTISSAQYRTN